MRLWVSRKRFDHVESELFRLRNLVADMLDVQGRHEVAIRDGRRSRQMAPVLDAKIANLSVRVDCLEDVVTTPSVGVRDALRWSDATYEETQMLRGHSLRIRKRCLNAKRIMEDFGDWMTLGDIRRRLANLGVQLPATQNSMDSLLPPWKKFADRRKEDGSLPVYRAKKLAEVQP